VTRLAVALAVLFPVLASAEETPQLSKIPRLTHFVEAEPPPALATRQHAEVLLILEVDERGQVGKVTVAEPAGDGFDEAAVAAAKQFVFEPGEYQGKPVPVRVTYHYKFTYKAPPPPPEPAEPAPPPGVPVEGSVLLKGERVPLGGVTIAVDKNLVTVVSDERGRFAFAVPPGDHTVALRGAGILPADVKLKATLGKRLTVTYFVQLKERYASTVRGKRPVVETVEQTLSGDEIRRIPGTQGDVLKAVQNLPGVARAPFGIGLLVVWGSSPQDTRTYVDGVYIPTLYHFGGLRSTINSEMVSSLTFTPGAYGVDHGLGLGGVVDVETRKPRTDGYHGYVQLDLIDVSAMAEGPIGKKVAFAVALRRSLVDLVLPLFTRNSNTQLSTVYYDYQARLTYRPTPRDDVDLFIFGSDDDIDILNKNSNPELSAEFGSHTYYHRGVLSWVHRFARRATLSVTGSIGYDVPFQFRQVINDQVSSVDPGLLQYTVRAVARVPLTAWLRLDAGVDYEGNRFTLNRQASTVGGATSQPDNLELYTNHIGPFVSALFTFFDKKLTINPQLRLQVLTFAGYPGTPNSFSSGFFRPEPRLSLRYQATRWMALKAAIGIYDQPPQWQSFSVVTGNPQLLPEWAVHYVAGFDFQPTPTLHIELEGFYKDMRNLVVGGEFAADPRAVNDGLGRVYGGQLLVRQELWKNFWGWISYTVSRSERRDHPDDPWQIYTFDQTHILTIIASYKLPRGFQLGLRFRYVTGNPYTPYVGAYYDSNQNRYIPLPGGVNSARLASFNQLDLRLDKTWTFNRWKLSAYLDLQNVYDATNPEFATNNFNFTHQTTINGLPILPVFGIRGDF
jgi:TonB family protein